MVQSYAEEEYSIFLTGSNSYLLSDRISTKLTGRYLNFETYTLDKFRDQQEGVHHINAIDLFLGKAKI